MSVVLRPYQRGFWRAYAITMRPYLLFVSGITGIAGMSLSPQTDPAAVIAVGAALFLAYGFGQALTDCFQLDTDRLSSPYRPLVRGTVLPRDVLIVSGVGLAVCGVIVTLADHRNALFGALTVGGLTTYTWFKRRWWGGPWYNAWIVALLVPMGFLGAGNPAVSGGRALLAAAAVAFFAYANFVLAGYYKDIAADRATGYHTLPVVAGRARSAWVSDGLQITAVLITTAIVVSAPAPVSAWPFLLGGALASAAAQVQLHGVRSDEDAHRPITLVVHAYVLLLAAVAAGQQPSWGVVLGLFYLWFVWTIRRRPARSQV